MNPFLLSCAATHGLRDPARPVTATTPGRAEPKPPGGIIGAVLVEAERRETADMIGGVISAAVLLIAMVAVLFLIGACIVAPEWISEVL